MKTASGSLISLLSGSNVYLMADLLTVTLIGAQVYRWAFSETDLVLAAQTFTAGGSGTVPLMKRGKTRITVGLEVDTLDLTLLCGDSAQILGIPLVQAAANGALDGARILLQRVFMPTWGDTSPGALTLFEGAVSSVEPSSTEIKVVVKSELERLNVPMPRHLFMPGCNHAVYDPGCGLVKSTFTVTGTATGVPTTTTVPSARGEAADYFRLGVLTMTSGASSGARRAVKAFSGGLFTLALPLPFAPAAGDTFSVYPGCDHTRATCLAKFANLNRFRGFPYVPRVESAR